MYCMFSVPAAVLWWMSSAPCLAAVWIHSLRLSSSCSSSLAFSCSVPIQTLPRAAFVRRQTERCSHLFQIHFCNYSPMCVATGDQRLVWCHLVIVESSVGSCASLFACWVFKNFLWIVNCVGTRWYTCRVLTNLMSNMDCNYISGSMILMFCGSYMSLYFSKTFFPRIICHFFLVWSHSNTVVTFAVIPLFAATATQSNTDSYFLISVDGNMTSVCLSRCTRVFQPFTRMHWPKLTACSFSSLPCRIAAHEFSFSEEPIRKSRITTARLLSRWGHQDVVSRFSSSTDRSSVDLLICFIFSSISLSLSWFSALDPACSWFYQLAVKAEWNDDKRLPTIVGLRRTTGTRPNNKCDATKAFRIYLI